MQWVTFASSDGREQTGRLIGDAVHVLPGGTSLTSLLGDDGERLARAGEEVVRNPDAILKIDNLKLLPPIPRPPSVRDFYAFEQHARWGRRSRGLELPPEWFELPVFYFTNSGALIGDGEDVLVPPGCKWLDYELEVAAIIGRRGQHLKPEEAERYIIGFTIMNDWSARDLQREEMKLGLGPSKGKDFATSLGPCLVTMDELQNLRKNAAYDLGMFAYVNGRQYSRGNLADIYWSFEEMVSYASRGTVVQVGDVIGSGTCATGCINELAQTHGQDLYPWLSPGDNVALVVDKIGTLRNTVRPGLAPYPVRGERYSKPISEHRNCNEKNFLPASFVGDENR